MLYTILHNIFIAYLEISHYEPQAHLLPRPQAQILPLLPPPEKQEDKLKKLSDTWKTPSGHSLKDNWVPLLPNPSQKTSVWKAVC